MSERVFEHNGRPSPRGSEAVCSACHRIFSRDSNFEKHFIGQGAWGNTLRCATDQELDKKGLTLDGDVWKGKPPQDFSLESLGALE